jgi:hypothetical protein
MRSFTEHLLNERALDAATVDAATQSFEHLRKHVLENISNTWKRLYENVKVGSAVRNSYLQASDMEVNAGLLVSQFRSMILGFDNIYFVNDLPSFSILSGDVNLTPNLLVLPPHITRQMWEKINPVGELRIVLAGKIEGASGTYASPRKKSNIVASTNTATNQPTDQRLKYEGGSNVSGYIPQITIGGMKSLSMSNFKKLATFLLTSATGRNQTLAEIKKFIAHIDNDLGRGRSIYIHEYTHLLDDVRYRGGYEAINITRGRKNFWSGDDGSKDQYYRSDIEWNAYFNGAAGLARDIVKSYLITMTSDGLAHLLLKKLGVSKPDINNAEIEDVFNSSIELRNQAVANKLRVFLKKKLERVSAEANPKYYPNYAPVFGKSRWSPLLLYVFRDHSRSAMDSWLKDEKLRRKFASRLYSVTQDMDKLVAEYLSRLEKGQTPSKSEWTLANLRSRTNEYHIMYDGMFMFAKDVYSPKKKYFFKDTEALIGLV